MNFGFGEVIIILAVVVLLFGGKKLPQLGSALGKAITNFKKGMNDSENQTKEEVDKDS